MASPISFQSEEYFREKIDKRAHDTFKSKAGKPQLQVHRLFTTGATEEPKRFEFVRNQDVADLSQIEALEKAGDVFQIFIIRQDRSWTTLNISPELFQNLSRVYDIFPPFWKAVFTFGRKYRENEFEFPRLRSLQTSVCGTLSEAQELTYVLRRVEVHNRELTDGKSPWSIRQTGVYHKLTHDSNSPFFAAFSTERSKTAFLLISPSKSIEHRISKCIDGATSSGEALSPWAVHLLLIAESQEGWMDYMAWLETSLKEPESDRIALAQVGGEGKSDDLSPFTDFTIEITDRQKLKLVEDSVIELQIILSTMLNTINRVRKECRNSCKRYHAKDKCGCKRIIEEFDEYTHEVEMHVERAQYLRDRARSTIQLLSDLLSYEDAAALKDMARQSRQESEAMHSLTEQSTKDATAVKVLTIIGLIYLPTTIVLNFFSTQFVHSTDTGNIRASHQTWLLPVFAVPLTMLTIGIWWVWAHCTSAIPLGALRKHRGPTFWRWASIRLLFSSRKGKPKEDVEPGEPSSAAVVCHNSSSHSLLTPADTTTTPPITSKPG